MRPVIKLVSAMVIWGSLGVFVKNIKLESFEIAFLRAVIASILLGIIFIIKSKKENKQRKYFKEYLIKENKKQIIILILCGISLGFNWVLLFQSYRYTTVSNATIAYYFAPVIVLFLSPIILKEKFTIRNTLSVGSAIIGLIMILSNHLNITSNGYNHGKGIMLALAAAFLYASIIIFNKYIQEFEDYERTFLQLFTASVVLLPFIIYRNMIMISDIKSLIFILIIGVVHTTIAYCLYFSAIKDINTQSAAILGYIDPVSAIVFSVIFLSELLSILQIIGGGIILISAYVSNKPQKNKIENNI